MGGTWVASHLFASTCSITPTLSGVLRAALRELSVRRFCSQAASGSGCVWVLFTAERQVVLFYVEGALFLVAACRVDVVWWDTRVDDDLACAQTKYHTRSL